MRSLIAVFLVTIFALPLTLRMGLIGQYWLEQDRYARELCQEKDMEFSSCSGKCHLILQLKRSEGNTSQPQLPEAAKCAVSDFITADTAECIGMNNEQPLLITFIYQSGLSDGFPKHPATPPRA